MFTRYERFVLTIIAVMAIVDLALIIRSNVRVDWTGYGVPAAFGAFTIGIGLFYRFIRNNARIAETLIMSACFVLFTLAGSVLNYMLLPIRHPSVDSFFVSVDHSLGYNWPDLVAFFAQWPAVAALLRVVYFTSLPQLVIVVLLHGFAGRSKKLAHFLTTGIMGALLCIAIWAFFPTFGTSAVWQLPDEIITRAGLVVGPSYGAELIRLSKEGVHFLTPSNVMGLIGFPSFHTVMASMSVVFTWRIAWLRLPALMWNLAMVPALLLHGGHHLSDFFGGLAVFAVAYFTAGYAINRLHSDKVELLLRKRSVLVK